MSTEPLILSRQQVRNIDQRALQEFGMRGVVLMENAGRGCADLLLERNPQGPVLCCCGKGNNGGDGFVIARHLENAGIPVVVALVTPESVFSGDALENLRVLRAAKTPIVELDLIDETNRFRDLCAQAEWIVDALLGTGTQGEIREPYWTAIQLMNAAGRQIFAVDLPSGLDCDSGTPLGPCVQATLTGTLVALKPGLVTPFGRSVSGEVHVVGIGVPQCMLTFSHPG